MIFLPFLRSFVCFFTRAQPKIEQSSLRRNGPRISQLIIICVGSIWHVICYVVTQHNSWIEFLYKVDFELLNIFASCCFAKKSGRRTQGNKNFNFHNSDDCRYNDSLYFPIDLLNIKKHVFLPSICPYAFISKLTS